MTTTSAADGATLWFDETGSGRTLVLVHGITESSASWDPLVPMLAPSHRVVRVDLRGHGRSERHAPYDLPTFAGDVRRVVEAVGAGDDAVVVGHSLGGAVASAYAALFGCRGVVNVDQPLALAGFQAGLQQLAPMLRGDEASFREAVGMIFESMRGQLDGAEAERIAAIRNPEQPVVMGVWDPVIDTPAEQLDAMVDGIASAIRVPYLALHGIDPGTDYAAWLESLVPSATVEVWDGVGHYPHLVEPERFVQRLEAFEASLPG